MTRMQGIRSLCLIAVQAKGTLATHHTSLERIGSPRPATASKNKKLIATKHHCSVTYMYFLEDDTHVRRVLQEARGFGAAE